MLINALTLKAYEFASIAHQGQTRDDGQDFMVHPIQVAEILSQITDDENIIAAALLHDVIEDTFVTYDGVADAFGKDVADLVNGFYFPRLQTQRGIMLKFADRLSNISDMKTWEEKRKQHYLRKSKFWKGEI
jgi:GTP pyrophosphokinase